MTYRSTVEITEAPVRDLIAWASEEPREDPVGSGVIDHETGASRDEMLYRLVRFHLRIAVDEAIRNRGLGLRQDHLVRVGVEALVKAAPEYDPVRHGTFADFARQQVRGAIGQALTT